MSAKIEACERALIKAALAQFRAHLKANPDKTADQWYRALKSEGRTPKALALVRAVMRLDEAIADEERK